MSTGMNVIFVSCHYVIRRSLHIWLLRSASLWSRCYCMSGEDTGTFSSGCNSSGDSAQVFGKRSTDVLWLTSLTWTFEHVLSHRSSGLML